jgi:subtilase family serine protease
MRRLPATSLPLSIVSTFILSMLIGSTLSFAAAPDRITGPVASGQLVRLSAGVPIKAQAQFDQGSVDPSLKLSYMTLLTVPSASQQKAIDQLLAQQQDRRSPLYHKWLTPEQYADRFGLSPNDIQKLTTWLQSQGFSVQNVARARNFIVFSGTAGQAQTAFQTQIHNFSINGQTNFSNIIPISVPTALAGVVSGVRGLSNFRATSFLQHKKPRYSYPLGNNEYAAFLAPGDLATIYDINALYTATPTPIDGMGQTLAVMGETDVYLDDINDFRSGFGLSTITGCTTNASNVITSCASGATNLLQYKVVPGYTDPGTPYSCGDLSEADLDLEWSGAIARNAQVIFVNAPVVYDGNCNVVSGNGVWDSWYYAVDSVVAPVITMSYGICELGEAEGSSGEGSFTSDEVELKLANSEGITFMNSSGDSGAAGCDNSPPGNNPAPPYQSAQYGQSVNYPASSPEVTGVGGTATTISEISSEFSTYWSVSNGSNGASATSYIPEAAWNDDAEIGAYCAANPTDTGNCDPTAVPGQIKITNQQTFQEDWWISSTGGGPSNCFTSSETACTGGFPQPTWQQGLSIPGQTTATRFVPDVSMLASPDFPGYIFCTAQSELIEGGSSASTCANGISDAIGTYGSIVGGTSASSPVFAGIVTLLNQDLGGSGQGNINPSLYQIATYYDPAVTSEQKAFNSVTASDFAFNPGSNTVYCQKGTPSGFPAAQVCPSSGANAGILGFLSSNADTTTGYNMVTGLGSVDANNLATAFVDLATSSTTTIATTATSPVFVGQSVTFTVTVTPSNASGVATFTNGAAFGAIASVAAGTGTLTTTQLPPGTNVVAATYKGIYKTSTSATPVTLTVVTPSFAVTPTTATLTIAPGSTAGPDTLTVTSTTNGFITGTPGVTAVPITYSCSGLPSESACVFSPSGATTSTTIMVSITTTAPTSGQLRKPLDRGNHILYATLIPGIFGIVFALGSRKSMGSKKRTARVVRLLSFIVVLGFSTMWLASCGGSSGGGGGGNPGTPAGTYPITINSTTGTTQGTAGTITLTVS